MKKSFIENNNKRKVGERKEKKKHEGSLKAAPLSQLAHQLAHQLAQGAVLFKTHQQFFIKKILQLAKPILF